MAKDKDECVKRNVVQLVKRDIAKGVEVYLVSHDESTEKLFNRAKKQFEEMVKE